MKKIRVHDIRHSAVSLLIDMGFSVLAIGERMGHEAEKITYRYAHLFPTVQTEMAEKLEMERMTKEDTNGKNTCYKGRWRNHTVAFRVSNEEANLLTIWWHCRD